MSGRFRSSSHMAMVRVMPIVAVMSHRAMRHHALMPDAGLPVQSAARSHDRAVGPVAVAPVQDRLAPVSPVDIHAGIFRRFADRILDGFAEFVQRVAVMLLGLSDRSNHSGPQNAREGGYDAASEKASHTVLLLPCAYRAGRCQSAEAKSPVACLERSNRAKGSQVARQQKYAANARSLSPLLCRSAKIFLPLHQTAREVDYTSAQPLLRQDEHRTPSAR